jgi:hypothetical protein
MGAMDNGIVNYPIAAVLDDSLVSVSAMANNNVWCLSLTPPPSPLTSPDSPHCALAANPTCPQAVSLTHDHSQNCESPLCCPPLSHVVDAEADGHGVVQAMAAATAANMWRHTVATAGC